MSCPQELASEGARPSLSYTNTELVRLVVLPAHSAHSPSILWYSFGSGQISVSKFMGPICSLLGDANSQVRSSAMETIVEIYRHVGVKVRIDLSKRGLPSARMSQLTARFDAMDATTGNHAHYSDEVSLCLD